jgi:hypothetical protein
VLRVETLEQRGQRVELLGDVVPWDACVEHLHAAPERPPEAPLEGLREPLRELRPQPEHVAVADEGDAGHARFGRRGATDVTVPERVDGDRRPGNASPEALIRDLCARPATSILP